MAQSNIILEKPDAGDVNSYTIPEGDSARISFEPTEIDNMELASNGHLIISFDGAGEIHITNFEEFLEDGNLLYLADGTLIDPATLGSAVHDHAHDMNGIETAAGDATITTTNIDAETQAISKPGANTKQEVSIESGQKYVCDFDPSSAKVEMNEDGQMVLTFADGSQILVNNYTEAMAADVPAELTLEDGNVIDTEELLTTVTDIQAPIEEVLEVANIEPAAGEPAAQQVANIEPAAGDDVAAALNQIEAAAGDAGGALGGRGGTGFNSTVAAEPLGTIDAVGALGETQLAYNAPQLGIERAFLGDDRPETIFEQTEVDETNIVGGNLQVSGNLPVDFGNDGPGTIAPTGNASATCFVDNGVLASGGQPITINSVPGGYEGVLSDGTVIFDFAINNAGDYVYNQFGPIDHSETTEPDEIICLNFGVIATDTDGDNTSTTIRINVRDDAPTILSQTPTVLDETDAANGQLTATGQFNADVGQDVTDGAYSGNDTFSAIGSVDNGVLTSNGSPVTVVFDSATNTFTGTDGNGTTVFTLELDPNTGAYEYNQLAPLDHADNTDPNDVLTLNFGVDVTDFDGDTASGQISIQVLDDGPIVGDAVNTVDETDGTDTVAGSLNIDFGQDGAGSVSPSDSFTAGGSLAGDALTSNGSPVTVTQTADGYVGTDGNGNTVFTMTIDAATGDYTFTQVAPLDHADGTDANDAITLNFGVNVSDFEGDTAGANITITVLDDGPVVVDAANSVDETDLTANGLVVNGSVNIDGGEDGLVSVGPSNNFTPGGSLANNALTSNGVAVVVTQTANGYVGTANGQTVFTMEIDPTTGDYTFTQNGPLDHADGTDPNDAITLDFGIVATDGDGDTGEGSITITVRDDAPVAHDDVNEFDVADGSTTGNVISGQNGGPGAADDLSNDAANTVTQVEAPDGTIIDVPTTGTVDVEGEFGTLTIASDGSYTYTLDANVIGGPGGTGSLNPGLADAEGFQSSFMNEGITVTANNGQDLSWVTTSNVGSGLGITGNGTDKVFGANEQLEISLVDGAETVAITIADLGANNVGDTFSMDVFLASDPTTPVRVDFTVGNNPDGTQTFDINAADFGPGAEIIGVNLVGGVSYLLADVDVNYAGEPVSDEFIYTIQDGDGDTSNATITFEGNPSPIGIIGVGSVDETDFVNGQGSESGDIFVNYQGDGQGTTTAEGTFTPGGSLANNALTTNGLPVIVALVGNTYTGTAGGETIFTMTINPDATYDFAQFAPIDHADGTDPNDAITLDFGVIATDSDGDAGEGTVTITVFDDAPIARDDTITVGEDDTGTGNVITNNDDQGEDTDATVTSVNFEGTDFDVPANGEVVIEGNSGTLTIGSDGDYTYEANGTPSETIRTFEVTDPRGNDAVGNIEEVSGSYNETTEELNFSFTIAGSDANGYTLVLNDGGNPKGHAGELVQFFFDNSGAEPVISVYGYNGLGGVPGTTASAFDGSQEDGIQAPDRIATSLGADSPFSNIVVTTDANGNQTFSFTMDATDLNDHSPLYPVAGTDFNGVQFGDEVGAWFHPVSGLETSYNDDGFLTQFDFDDRGGWDSSSVPTNTENVFGDDEFTYTITDSDGDTSTATLDVSVDADVGPTGIFGEESTDDTTVNTDGSDAVTGDITVNYNGDDAGSTSGNGDFSARDNVNLPNGELTHEGTPVEVTFDAATNTYTGKAGNVTVFTMEIKPDATYTFTQLASIDHANTASRNESITLNFGVTATDADGDTGQGVVYIRVADDFSNAINDTTSVTEGNFATGNILDNDVFGADSPTTLTTVEFGGTDYAVPATGTVTVEGTYGTLILDATGDYTYTPNDGNPQGIDDFNYTIVDGDGDSDTARFRVNVSSQNDVPVITAETDSVDETFGESTVDGTITVDFGSDTPGTLMGSNEFSATGSTGATLTSCGEPVVVTYDAQTGVYTGTSHGDTIFTMTIDPSGSYEFTLLGALDHADQTDPNDAINLNFGIKAVDGDGSVGTTNVVITVLDSAPEISKDSTRLDESDFTNGPLTGGDTLVVDYGQDGAGEVSANGRFEVLHEVGGAPQPLTANGSPITVTNTATGYTGTVAGGQVAFTLTLNPTTAEYVYTQYVSLDHPDGDNTDDVMWLKFYVDATDKDGDVDTTFINIDIHDSDPEANNDSGVVGEGETVNGNVLNNDDIGSDDPGMVCGVTFNGQTVTVPATGTVQVTGSYGVLTIAADGTYSYTANSNNPDGTDVFTYEMKDADGDTDTATLSITVSADDRNPISINGVGQTDDTNLNDDGMDMITGSINVNYQGDGPGTTTGSGNFGSAGNQANGALTSNGVAVNVSFNANTNTYTGVAGNTTVFTMVINDDATYKFTQLEAVDHSNTNSNNEALFLDFGVTATDSDGDTGTGTVRITVRDDAPEAPNNSVFAAPESGLADGTPVMIMRELTGGDFGEDGPGSYVFNGDFDTGVNSSFLNGEFTSNGQPVTVTFTDNVATGTAGGQTVFTLEIDPQTGKHTFTGFQPLDHGNPNASGAQDVIWLKFGVDIVDFDGDSEPFMIQVDFRDGVPVASDDTVNIGSDNTTATGNVLTNDETGPDDGANVMVTTAGTFQGDFGTLVLNMDGSYTYTRNGDQGGTDVFDYTMKDNDGDTSSAQITVTVADDLGPISINGVGQTDDTNLNDDGMDMITGSINVDYQGDGPGTTTGSGNFGSAGNQANGALTSNGVAVNVSFNANTNTYTGVAGNTIVFTMVINSTGTYKFTQLEAVDHSNTNSNNEALFLDFGVTATDSDGDTGTGTVRITVRDDAPEAADDTGSVSEGETSGGNVLTNDDLGADDTGMVIAVRFNGQTVDVPTTGTVSVSGEFGVLTIATDGTYTYVANTNNPDGTDIFTYTMKDADGDTSMANLSIDVTSVNDVPEITNSVFPVGEADLCHGGISVTKTLNHDFGDDGKGSIEPNGTVQTLFQVGGNNQTLTSNGQEVVITQTNDGYVGKVGNTTVFNLDVNPSTGQYTYTQLEPVDHPGVGAEGTQDVIWLKFGVTITDSDGDSADGFIQVDIRDSAPTANDDNGIVKANGTIESHELNITSGDVAGNSSSFTRDGITIKSNNGADLRWVNVDDGSSGVGIAGNGTDKVWSGGEEMHVRFNGGVTTATLSIGELANNIGQTITYTVLLTNGTSVHESITLTSSNVSHGVVDIQVSGYSSPISGVNVTGGASYVLNDVTAQNVTTDGGEATGNVLNNDHVCAEGGNVTSVQFGNKIVDVPSHGSATINGANGTLTIKADGSYSYESNNTQSQTIHTFSIDNPPGSAAAGDIKNVSTSYNETTRDFTFSMTVEPTADAIEFAVNDGPNPKNHPGELAFFYVDDSGAEPVVTVYAYNGSSVHSWKDGSSESGNQPADKILSSLTNPEAFSDISVTVDANGNKIFSISLDVTEIQNHDPVYGPNGIWEGVDFSDNVGIWSHALSDVDSEYGNDGFLTQFDYDNLSYYDVSNQNAYETVIPGVSGDDEFTYTVTDADGDTDTATLSINGDPNTILVVEDTDQYFGTNDADAFLFQAINDSAVTINNFNTAEGDCLDLSAVLENYDETTDAINDFVYTTQSGGNTIVSVDVDGAGGAPAQEVAVLEGVTGLSAADLIDNGNLVT